MPLKEQLNGGADQGRELQVLLHTVQVEPPMPRLQTLSAFREQPFTWVLTHHQHPSISPPEALAAAPQQPPAAEEAGLCHVLGPGHLDLGQELAAVRPTSLSVAFLPSWHLQSDAAAAGQQQLIPTVVLGAAAGSAQAGSAAAAAVQQHHDWGLAEGTCMAEAEVVSGGGHFLTA